MQTYETLFIGGEWVKPETGDLIDVISPHTEQVIGQVPDASPADIDNAVAAARKAFDAGPLPVEERAAGLSRLSAALQARGEAIADSISSQMGSPKSWSIMGQVFSATMVLDTYAAIADVRGWTARRCARWPAAVRRACRRRGRDHPWNVPLFIMALKLGPVMAAGVPIVLKPAPGDSARPHLFAEAVLEADLPPGIINIVPAGRENADYLVRHPDVDKVSFTGSTAVGKHIASVCGEQLKRVTLELGGKSAAIVLDDVVLDDTLLNEMVMSGLMNNGQVWGAISHPGSSRNTTGRQCAGGQGRHSSVGDPSTRRRRRPLVAQRQQARVEGFLEAGKAAGARAVVGGAKTDQETGWYITPTVFADVDNDMKIAREEIFGPVLSVIPYDGEENAISIANDTDYGLCGSVWTADVEHGAAVAARVRTGTVAINSSMILDFNGPFGGFKQSGLGRELGPEGIAPYTELQTVILPAG